MNRRYLLLIVIFLSSVPLLAQDPGNNNLPGLAESKMYSSSRPWTRWWWFASEIREADVVDNLKWLKDNGFGGVEIAWVYPLNRAKKDTVNYTPRQAWLSPEWTKMVVFAKHCADSLGLGCDFTFGSLWPFGDLKVPRSEATMNMKDTAWRQQITASWDYPRKGLVLNHLDREAFRHYAERTGNALKPALAGSMSGLFCDSWEVDTRYLSDARFAGKFLNRYSYSILEFTDSLYANSDPYRQVRYDYQKLVSDLVIDEFYKPYTEKCHELGAYSRAQCSGAPCDIISAYATIDVPESEALLYEPAYSTIVASAAGLSGKKVVTSETFTCLYGWPNDHHSMEQTADLKLLADALFANGVNQVIWHGKPLNPAGYDTVKFYASVHVGKNGSLAREIPAFNKYMETVSGYMRTGKPYARVAVYMPTEDAWVAGELPVEKQFIWAWGEYEMRYTCLPEELKPWRPAWINGEFLQKAEFRNGELQAGDFSFNSLYVDVKYMDIKALRRIVELAGKGLPVCLKQVPAEPGYKPEKREFQSLVNRLVAMAGVKATWPEMAGVPPVIAGYHMSDYWCREREDGLVIFFANPKSLRLTFPLQYGQSLNGQTVSTKIEINYQGRSIPFTIRFSPYQSVLLHIGKDGQVKPVDLDFIPAPPVFEPRAKKGRERWEVDPGSGK